MYNSGSNFAADASTLQIKFVVGIWGQRTVTQAAFTGAQTGDSVLYNGGSPSVQPLPTGRVVASTLGLVNQNWAGTAVGNPIVIFHRIVL